MEAPPRIISLARPLLNKLGKHQKAGHSSLAHTTTEPIQDNPHRLAFVDHSTELDDPQVTLIAQGGYNDVWLVQAEHVCESSGKRERDPKVPFVLRVPNEDSLKPHQIQNEVGWLAYMAKHCPEIPVPVVYEYSDGSNDSDSPFIAEQYMDAESLCVAWKTYTESEKDEVARKLAELVVRLGDLRFEAIGGMTPDGSLGPTVEGAKLFKGRDSFHNLTCYSIGPYDSIKQYILAYYDKEIYYHSHADDSVLDPDLFEDVTPTDFAHTLKEKRALVEVELERSPRSEPFVLCHNDLQARNILMDGTNIAAVIDWEFAGSFPLSELCDGGIEVLEIVDEESEEECFHWCEKISKLVGQVAMERGWKPSDVELLTGGGDSVLQGVRVEMIPES